jgi:serine/threonine protein kinase
MRLRLRQDWEIGDRIGRGGFGKVYLAESATGIQAVVKLVPKAPGAQRELLFVDLGNTRHIVPIIDSGETENSWALVMPRAEKSLRDYLNEKGAPLSITEAVEILSDIALALADLDGRVVHRDLKPENVLLLAGHWCLADFGISRYAEATTAPDTQKYAMSPPYAAPERWRAERAKSATDVYSVGIIAYELLSGSRPFNGPDWADFRDQHLHHDPAPLGTCPTALAALVEECLYKAPGARPTPANLVARLARVSEAPSSPGLMKLLEANQAAATAAARKARMESEARSESERRSALIDAANNQLASISRDIRLAIVSVLAPSLSSIGDSIFTLNRGIIQLPAAWCNYYEERPPLIPFDVIASSGIVVGQVSEDASSSLHTYYQSGYSLHTPYYVGRAHSLWFCDPHRTGNYCWFETAFMTTPGSEGRARRKYREYLADPRINNSDFAFYSPVAFDPIDDQAQWAFYRRNEWAVAWPFSPLIVGSLDDFIDRWANWFAAASQEKLQPPSEMPEIDPSGSWRQD